MALFFKKIENLDRNEKLLNENCIGYSSVSSERKRGFFFQKLLGKWVLLKNQSSVMIGQNEFEAEWKVILKLCFVCVSLTELNLQAKLIRKVWLLAVEAVLKGGGGSEDGLSGTGGDDVAGFDWFCR